MPIKKLVNILLASSIGLNCNGKINNDKYDFRGGHKNDEIIFKREGSYTPWTSDDTNYLIIIGKDSTKSYIDQNNDLIVDEIHVIKPDVEGEGLDLKIIRSYRNGKPNLSKEQKEFEEYLKKILDFKKITKFPPNY